MKIFAQNFNIESPHYSTIRQWLGRIGLYELNREKEQLQDWICIVDLTLELGQETAQFWLPLMFSNPFLANINVFHSDALSKIFVQCF